MVIEKDVRRCEKGRRERRSTYTKRERERTKKEREIGRESVRGEHNDMTVRKGEEMRYT